MTASAFKSSLVLAIAILAAATSPLPGAPADARATVVIFNKNDPDSGSLARYYAGKRNIPPAQIVGLDCSAAEEITRTEYDQTIAGPLRSLFLKRGWWIMGRDLAGNRIVTRTTVRFLAIMRGVPLKISADPTIPPATFINGLPQEIAARNEAAVDSELATLGLPVPGVGGICPNPYFRRFTPILENPVDPGMLLAARLDGPTPITVRAMIDDAISTERSGLWGWAYVDGRNITSGGYAEGDTWMRNLVAAMRPQGIPVIFENTPPTFPEGYPLTDAAVYYGWYAASVEGPFMDPKFQFKPGAIAVHIHSFSAATVRSGTAQWCGPLLARGAAATLGNVYEPYLSLTANLDIFQDRLMAGFTLAESAYIAQRVLSWMGTVIGDPLYRPYAAWSNPGVADKSPWQTYRRIVTASPGGPLAAAAALREAAKTSQNGMFLEALGAAQFDAGQTADALRSFQSAASLTESTAIKLRLDLEMITTLRTLGRAEEAAKLALTAVGSSTPGPQQNLFLQTSGQHIPATPSPTPIALTNPIPEATPGSTAPPPPTATPPPTPPPTPLPPPPIPDLHP
jgi:uncharacterized protein (TIGR03790 family)